MFDKCLAELKRGDENAPIIKWFVNDMNESYNKSNLKERIVLDYIADMTDNFFNNEFHDAVFSKNFGLELSD